MLQIWGHNSSTEEVGDCGGGSGGCGGGDAGFADGECDGSGGWWIGAGAFGGLVRARWRLGLEPAVVIWER